MKKGLRMTIASVMVVVAGVEFAVGYVTGNLLLIAEGLGFAALAFYITKDDR